MKPIFLTAFAAALVLGSGISQAADSSGEFSKVLAETEALWKQREFGEVKKNLDYMGQLVAQERLQEVKSSLPKPPEGWTASEIEGQAVGAAMMGGGTTASITYRNKAGADVRLEVTGDNPALAQMMSFVTNPMVTQSSGTEVLRIGREQAVYQDGSLKFMTNGFLVDLSGSGTKDAKIWFANAVSQNLAKFK